jgi:hypothetical protein
MAHDIFISYSSKDKPIADGICANLEAAGIRCWIAPRDIAPGEEWPRAITNAISKSKVMVLVFSANSNSSSDVGREIVLAANHNLVIIPFKIENIEPEPGKQYYLAQTHWLEAMNPPTRGQIQMLVERVKALVPAVEVDGSVQTAINPIPSKGQSSISKKNGFRLGYLWIVAALLIVILGVALWPRIQGMSVIPTATLPPTLTATDIPLPTATILPTATKVVITPTPEAHYSLLKTLSGHTNDVLSVAFSPDGSTLASSSKDYTVMLWDTSSWTALKTLAVFTNEVGCVTFSLDGSTMASGSGGGIMLWDTANWTKKQTLTGHTGGVRSLAFSPDGSRLASGSNDTTIILWDTTNYSKLRTLNDHISFVWSLAYSPDGRSLASAGYVDSTIMVNDTSSGTKLQTLDGNAGDVFSVDFSPDGQTLVSAARDELIILWDTSTWKKVRSFSPGVYAVFSPDGRTLAGGTYGGEVILWDVSSGTRLQTLTGHSEHVLSLAFSADGKLLASGSRDGKVMIWKLDNP